MGECTCSLHTCGGQRTICKNWFSPSILWVSGLTQVIVRQLAPFNCWSILLTLFFLFLVFSFNCSTCVYVCKWMHMNSHTMEIRGWCQISSPITLYFETVFLNPGLPDWLDWLTSKPCLPLLLLAHGCWAYKPRSLCLYGRYITLAW